MNGVIDTTLHRWRNEAGAVAPAMRNKFGQHICPVCSSNGDEEILNRLPDQPVWACAKQHSFQEGSVPNERARRP